MNVEGYELALVDCPEYQKHSPSRYPYPHQARVFKEWQEQQSFFVTTRTGSGKTATAAFPVFVHGESAIFVYPTNALLEDQAQSVLGVGSQLGKRVEVLDGKEPINHQAVQEADHVIVVLNGDSLERFQYRFENVVKTKGDAIQHLLFMNKPMILLTNPDVLFLLAGLRYSGSGRTLGLLQSFSTLVVDEFHLYSGLELAHALFLLYYLRELGVFKRILFLSATPSEQTADYVRRLFKPLLIGSEDVGLRVLGHRDVMHDLQLSAVGTTDVVKNMVEEVRKRKDELLAESLSSETNPVPLVIIVNSVIQAMRLEEELVNLGFDIEEIASYRGLINSKYRSTLGKRIVVGTSAIEVGVDFDCTRLFFEARDASSFLQRLGRAGRHRKGEAILFCESRVYNSLQGRPEYMTREELESWVRDTFRVAEDMAWFVLSTEGLWSAYSLLAAGMKEIEQAWVLTTEQQELVSRQFKEIFDEYLNHFEEIGSSKKLKLQKIFPHKVTDRPGSWEAVWVTANMFRAGSYSVDVFCHREKWMGREQDAGYFSADLKRVLEQGTNPTFSRKDTVYKGKGHIKAEVDTFGKKIKTRVIIPNIIMNKLTVVPHKDIAFESEFRGSRVDHLKLEEIPMIYVAILSHDLPRDLDWRIETWLNEDGDYVAFGGHALLLKAFQEHYKKSL